MTTHLNEQELADRWNISVRTLQRWRSIKKEPAFLKLGSRVVYRLVDVEACEEALRRSASVNPAPGQ